MPDIRRRKFLHGKIIRASLSSNSLTKCDAFGCILGKIVTMSPSVIAKTGDVKHLYHTQSNFLLISLEGLNFFMAGCNLSNPRVEIHGLVRGFPFLKTR